MSERSTLRSLLENLGTEVLRVVAAPSGLDVSVGHPVIDDPIDPPPIEAGDILLAVATQAGSPGAAEVIERAERGQAAAVLFRDAGRFVASPSASVAVLSVVPQIAWSQLHTLLRSAVAAGGSSNPETEAAGRMGDLYSLANAIAAMVGGPTTIEDPQSTVLAYSCLNSPIDDARRQTILGRRVPEDWLDRLHRDGVFRRLWASDEVLRIEYPEVPEYRTRLAVAVRAGGEVLGSIWVAQDKQPLGSGAEVALREASAIAALHLLRARSGEDLHRSWRSNLLRAMLDGHAVGPILAEALETVHGAWVTVVAFRLPAGAVLNAAVEGGRACRLLDLYCESTRRRGSSVAIGPVVYLILVDDAEPREDRIAALAKDMVEGDSQMLPVGTVAAVGSSFPGFESVPVSRAEADRVLSILASAKPPRTFGTIHNMRGHAVLMRLRELARAEPDLTEGRIRSLQAHDPGGRARYIETLRAYLDSFGDVSAAAAQLSIHPNTFRYRMRRLTEQSGLVLADPVERLVAHLQLHLDDSQG